MSGVRLYREFHWGREPKGIRMENTLVPEPGEQLVKLGELTLVQYYAAKDDYHRRLYIHDFEAPKPELACDATGKQLFIIGGGYRIKEEGIVG